MKKERKSLKIRGIYFLRTLVILVLVVSALAPTGVIKGNINAEASLFTLSQFGSRGDEVRQIQKKLKALGYYTGTVDGVYGTNTKKAVTSFQRNCGLTADGIAGPKTLKFLGLTSTSSSSGAYSQNDIYLLAKLIAAEARGESYRGQVAVGAVVLNRVSHSSFPDSVAGVIYQNGAFSCIYDSNWNTAATSESLKAAKDCVNGWDPTGGSIYYYNPKKTSNSFMTSRPAITTIGNHIFCK